MSDLKRYWTTEFAELFVSTLNSDAGFQKAARKFDDSIELVCLDAPDGKDVSQTLHIRNGSVTQDLVVEDAPSALRNAPFDKKKVMARTTAPYPVWCKLDRGEMNVVQALASPDHKVEGPKLKIAKALPVLNALSAVAAGIDKKY
jgi:putative sterol carrier protein